MPGAPRAHPLTSHLFLSISQYSVRLIILDKKKKTEEKSQHYQVSSEA